LKFGGMLWYNIFCDFPGFGTGYGLSSAKNDDNPAK